MKKNKRTTKFKESKRLDFDSDIKKSIFDGVETPIEECVELDWRELLSDKKENDKTNKKN